jgi:hypothetical protein
MAAAERPAAGQDGRGVLERVARFVAIAVLAPQTSSRLPLVDEFAAIVGNRAANVNQEAG